MAGGLTMLKFVLFFLFLLVVLSEVESRGMRGRGKGFRGRGRKMSMMKFFRPQHKPKPPMDVYKWEQILSSGQYVNQSVYVTQNQTSVAIVKVGGNEEAGFLGAKTVFNFGNETVDVITAVRSLRTCFMFNYQNYDFDSIVEAAGNSNGTTNDNAYPNLAQDGCSDPLSDDQRRDLYEAHPDLKRLCRSMPIVEVTAPTDPPSENNTTVVKFITFDQEISLTVPAKE